MSCRMIGAIDDDDDGDESSPGRVAICGVRSSSTVPSPRHTPTGSDMVPRGNLMETQSCVKLACSGPLLLFFPRRCYEGKRRLLSMRNH